MFVGYTVTHCVCTGCIVGWTVMHQVSAQGLFITGMYCSALWVSTGYIEYWSGTLHVGMGCLVYLGVCTGCVYVGCCVVNCISAKGVFVRCTIVNCASAKGVFVRCTIVNCVSTKGVFVRSTVVHCVSAKSVFVRLQ